MQTRTTIVAVAAVLALAVAAPAVSHAEAPYQVAWARQIGTSGSDDSYSVAVDASGNPYITGCTYGSLGGTNAGRSDPFLTKYDRSGNLLWSRQIGTLSLDYSRSVALDALGSAYISGYTSGSLGGTNAGGDDAFLVKFVVPEPASAGLLLLGLPLLLRRHRSRTHSE